MSFVEPAPVEFDRDAWPLHVTWVPPFDAAENGAAEVARAVEGRTALGTAAVGEAWFGARRDVRVTELALTTEVEALHRALVAALPAVGVDLARMRHVGDAYRPHVSAQRGRALSVGVDVRLDEVALVAMRPDGDVRRRRVVRTWPLH